MRLVREVKPFALVHCAMGSPQWAEDMARVCAEEGSKFLYVSSASVYGTQQQGPLTVNDTPVPCDDYGRYKLECEHRVRAANDQAIVVRIGWQMALRRGGNNMVEHLAQQQAEHGHLAASTEWFPRLLLFGGHGPGFGRGARRGAGRALSAGGQPWLEFLANYLRLKPSHGRGLGGAGKPGL